MTEITPKNSIAIVLTDVVGLDQLFKDDEQSAMNLLREQREIINPVLEKFDGTMFIAGDHETMLMFDNITKAVECALDIQKKVNAESDLTFRMGVHLEEVASGHGRISEKGVKVASEILSYAAPGGISLSERARNSAGDTLSVDASPTGRRQLQWLEDPTEIYELELDLPKPSKENEVGLLKDLWDRRVPHILGFYLASSWGVVEFVSSLLVDRYQFSPELITITLFALLLMIPSVLMIAYFHGRPGPDEWTKFEKIGIPVNIIISAGILLGLFLL